VPYYAWINADGRLQYLTDGKALTAGNLAAFINGQSIQSATTQEEELRFNPLKPLFIRDYGGTGEAIVWYSVLSKYIVGMPWVSGIARDSSRSIALIYNSPVKAMYQAAYNDYPDNSLWIPDNRTILEVKDSSQLVYKANGLYQTNHYWCYQLITPTMEDKAIRKIMQSDLNKYFRLKAQMEKRKMLCWVLSAADTNLIKATGGERKNYHDAQGFSLLIQNEKMSSLLERFTYHLLGNSPYPFFDNTHYNGNVTVSLHDIFYDNPATIQKAVMKYKMTLVLEEREIDMLVIRDN
jgi:hypothetical protein